MDSLLVIIIKTIRLYEVLLLIRVFLTWVPHDRRNPVIDILCRITDPLLDAARGVFAAIFGLFKADIRNFPVDFSPALAFLFIEFVVKGVVIFIFGLLM